LASVFGSYSLDSSVIFDSIRTQVDEAPANLKLIDPTISRKRLQNLADNVKQEFTV
jgi:hypothetical protein